MFVRFIQAIASPTWSYRPREIHDLPKAVALEYIERGIAEALEEQRTEPEAAVLPDVPEAAVERRARRRQFGE